MNIFVLDENPIVAASMQCDKHVVKMILESAQMLSTAARLDGLDVGYKPAYVNHPCTVWVSKSRHNFLWLMNHAKALADEYQFRYVKTHASSEVLGEILDAYNSKYDNFEDIGYQNHTSFAQAMPDQYRNECAVTAYRNYYINEKSRIAAWNRGRNPPQWYVSSIK